MADDTANLAYPLQFDPSQFSNKYSSFAGQSLNPFMGQYYGGPTGPTDARGNPIQSYADAQAAHDAWAAANPAPSMAPSTTLNSNAGMEPLGSQARAMQNAGYGAAGSIQGRQGGAGSVAATTGWNPANPSSTTGVAPGGGAFGAGVGGQGQTAGGQTNPVDMGQAYLNALSNPGKVTTPGATVPNAPTATGQSGVLQQFLNNWQQGGGQTTGAGNYNNAGFFNALKGMV